MWLRLGAKVQVQEGETLRALFVCLAMLVVALAVATPENWETFKSVYGVKLNSRIFKAECMTCHTEVPQHNLFGKDAKAAATSNKGVVTLEILRSLESKDSDGDGWSNIDEIKQDFLPGDANSHPTGMPPGQDDHKKMMGANMNAKSDPARTGNPLDVLIPRHSFHPLIVHFPIALFIFGALLELAGWRKRPALRDAAWYCLLGGALSTFLAVPTGLLLFYRSGFQWQGLPVIHVSLALSATALMISTVLWRRKGVHESPAYFILLALAVVAVSAAGHFGAQMVYGG